MYIFYIFESFAITRLLNSHPFQFQPFWIAVNFWVLALDHDLQIASGAIGTVSVKDHAGTKVALWDEVPLDEGKTRNRFRVSSILIMSVIRELIRAEAPINVKMRSASAIPCSWNDDRFVAGVKAFTLPLSEYVRAGRWLLHVEVESSEFSAPIEVAPGAGKYTILPISFYHLSFWLYCFL